MKILLLGKSGQVGSEIHKQALQKGYEVYAYGHDDLDITDYEKVKKEILRVDPDVVVNTTAYHVVPECELYPEKAFHVNSAAIINLALLCAEVGSVLIHYSTDKVFDGFSSVPYKESDNPHPLQIYGISKLAGEFVAMGYNPKTIIIRTCGIYGGKEGSRSKGGNFVLYILREAKKNDSLEVSFDQKANFVYAQDLAWGTLELLEKNAASGIYHLVNEGYGSWAAFAQEIVKQSGSKLKIIPVDRKGIFKNVKSPQFTVLANTKAKKLGISLPQWKDGLSRYLQSLNLHEK